MFKKPQARREFFKNLGLTSLFMVSYFKEFKVNNIISYILDDNENICKNKFNLLIDSEVKNKSIGEVISAVGKSFMGTEYVGNTLEVNPESERLIINLTGLDCVTFVENCLTFSRCLKDNRTSFKDYKKELEKIRYRDGIIDSYGSRLHYFTDWIYNNQEKDIVKDITQEIGGIVYDKKINFMSTHPKTYNQLSDKNNLEQIKIAEEAINSRNYYYIPKDNISQIYDSLQNGDIVATTTNIPGLDVTHTGFVYKEDGGTYFMHASLKNKQVIVSDNSLANYVSEDSKKTGIIIARPQQVK